MSKVKKIWLGIGIAVLSLLVIGGIVFWLLYPELTAQWANVAWDWLNAPLPVVGVSIFILGGFVIKFISMTSWGKTQVAKLKAKYEDFKSQVGIELDLKQTTIDEQKAELEEMRTKYEYLKNQFIALCEIIKNKKVNELGEKVKNEETINSDATKE